MDPLGRLTAINALKHPWIVDMAPDTEIPNAVLQSLGTFQAQMRLRKAVAKVISNQMSDQDMETLGTLFKKFDLNGDGRLSLVSGRRNSQGEWEVLIGWWWRAGRDYKHDEIHWSIGIGRQGVSGQLRHGQESRVGYQRVQGHVRGHESVQ